MPSEPSATSKTSPAATAKRAPPFKILAQPIQKKFCCPCITPRNSGSQNESSTTATVIHKLTALGNFHAARICACQKNTAAAPSSTKPSVPSHASRIMPASWRSRFVASARAVCCAKTICNGIFGTHIATASITPNAPYSAAEIFLLNR